MNRIQRNGLTLDGAKRIRDNLIQHHPYEGVGVVAGPGLKPIGDACDLAYLVDAAIEQHARLAALEPKLRELETYLRPYADGTHKRHGDNCGQDVCVLCLCRSLVEEAISLVF